MKRTLNQRHPTLVFLQIPPLTQTGKNKLQPNLKIPCAADRFGGTVAFHLRLRLLSLLAKVSHHCPTAFTLTARSTGAEIDISPLRSHQ